VLPTRVRERRPASIVRALALGLLLASCSGPQVLGSSPPDRSDAPGVPATCVIPANFANYLMLDVPCAMTLDRETIVSLQITPRYADWLIQQRGGKGDRRYARTNKTTASLLSSEGVFALTFVGSNPQQPTGSATGYWEWLVMPLKPGSDRLLVVTLRDELETPAGTNVVAALPAPRAMIRVEAPREPWVERLWDWILEHIIEAFLGAIVAGCGAYVVARMLRSGKGDSDTLDTKRRDAK